MRTSVEDDECLVVVFKTLHHVVRHGVLFNAESCTSVSLLYIKCIMIIVCNICFTVNYISINVSGLRQQLFC